MIEFLPSGVTEDECFNEIHFDDEDLPKLIKVIQRGLNTLSPPDHDLIKLLEDMKK